MTITGSQFGKICRALLTKFNTEDQLRIFLKEWKDVNLAEIASGNLSTIVFDLVQWAESRGLTRELVISASEYKGSLYRYDLEQSNELENLRGELGY